MLGTFGETEAVTKLRCAVAAALLAQFGPAAMAPQSSAAPSGALAIR